MNLFAERLRNLRNEQERSQEDIGNEIGVSRYAVYTYEKGRSYPDVPHLMALADYFQVSTDYLLGRSDQR